MIATQGRKEDGEDWASKWPSSLVTHLVCLINAHVMKLRRGKKLHGVVIMLKIFATRQSNECFLSEFFFDLWAEFLALKSCFDSLIKNH